MGNNKSDYILAKFDVGGIQDYIFATNRLRENAVVEQEDGSHQPITAQIHYETESENVTRIQLQKRNAYKDIVHYKRLFPVLDNGVSYGYPEEMDQLSREYGEDSMVAVVHIDGNGMGDRMNGVVGLSGLNQGKRDRRGAQDFSFATYPDGWG